MPASSQRGLGVARAGIVLALLGASPVFGGLSACTSRTTPATVVRYEPAKVGCAELKGAFDKAGFKAVET